MLRNLTSLIPLCLVVKKKNKKNSVSVVIAVSGKLLYPTIFLVKISQQLNETRLKNATRASRLLNSFLAKFIFSILFKVTVNYKLVL